MSEKDKMHDIVAKGRYALSTPPKPVGAWILDPQGFCHTQLAMYSKPTDEQIKNTEAMFGWKWKDLA
jgi:hypothetical protein